MQRRRDLAAAPQRNAPEVWHAIRTLIGTTLERSSSIERRDVDLALDPLDTVSRILISAGHLEKHPMVLVAGELWLEIRTVSGAPALTLAENLNPVPGAASATNWTLFVPQVEPMAKLVRTTVKGKAHLSAEDPTVQAESNGATAGSTSAVDLEALAHWAREGT